jgi:hypothetical protein
MAIEQQPRTEEPTIGRLVHDASRDISLLVNKEIQLAKSELKISIKAGGIGAALFAAAGFLAVLGVILLSVTIAYFINWNGSGLSLHWAFLIVTGFWFFLAALLAFVGIKKFKQVGPPEKTIEQGKQIPAALRGKTD